MTQQEQIIAVVGLILSLLSIVAIFFGPIVALQTQRRLDQERQAQERKLWLFKTLMSNRQTRLALPFVQGLNLIDIEFNADNPEERAVRNAWKELNDLFANFNKTPNAVEKSNDLVAALLAAMGTSVGYEFDTVYLKKGGYYPEFLANMELEQHSLRKQLLELLDGTGKRKIPVAVFEQKFAEIISKREVKN